VVPDSQGPTDGQRIPLGRYENFRLPNGTAIKALYFWHHQTGTWDLATDDECTTMFSVFSPAPATSTMASSQTPRQWFWSRWSSFPEVIEDLARQHHGNRALMAAPMADPLTRLGAEVAIKFGAERTWASTVKMNEETNANNDQRCRAVMMWMVAQMRRHLEETAKLAASEAATPKGHSDGERDEETSSLRLSTGTEDDDSVSSTTSSRACSCDAGTVDESIAVDEYDEDDLYDNRYSRAPLRAHASIARAHRVMDWLCAVDISAEFPETPEPMARASTTSTLSPKAPAFAMPVSPLSPTAMEFVMPVRAPASCLSPKAAEFAMPARPVPERPVPCAAATKIRSWAIVAASPVPVPPQKAAPPKMLFRLKPAV
jgi:hypothetical protein